MISITILLIRQSLLMYTFSHRFSWFYLFEYSNFSNVTPTFKAGILVCANDLMSECNNYVIMY
jgi:hypothetical protein